MKFPALFPYEATTRGLIVRVSVNFLPEQSEPDRSRWFWAYHIRIENEGDDTVQLLTRTWYITDARGYVQQVHGDGVVGDQPVLQPGKSYDYVSGCPLGTASGRMHGHYGMLGILQGPFDIVIPEFPLQISAALS
jgi:ApaG protein